jgi:GH24 family phage-related lysozyme (muramidase)
MNRKTVFDAVRRLLGRGFKQVEVEALDRALDAAMRNLDYAGNELALSDDGLDLIKEFEGCKLTAYPDPGTGGKPWTIGYGATRIDGRPVRPGETITQAQADKLLLVDIERHADPVRDMLGSAPTTQGQFDALVSFAFNLGPDSLKRSTLFRKHMEGDYEGAANEFARWNKANGRVLRGLTRRRAAEAAMYRGNPA